MKKLTPELKIKKALIALMREEPFFASLLLKMEIVEEERVGTFGTNGSKVFYSPSFVETLTPGNVRVILTHEAMHVGLGHHLRSTELSVLDLGVVKAVKEGKSRQKEMWNIAGDMAINSHLDSDKDCPEEGTFAGKGEWADYEKGKNAETYYARIKKEDDKCNRSGSDGGDRDQGPSQDGQIQKAQGDQGSDSDGSPSDNNRGNEAVGENGKGGSDSTNGGNDGDHGRSPSDGDQGGSTGQAQSDGKDGSGMDGISNRDPDKIDRGQTTPFGTVMAPEDQSEEGRQEAEKNWEQMVAGAMVEAKGAGKMPGWMEEAITEKLKVAQVPWEQALRPMLTSFARGGFSYRRPSRRFSYLKGVIMPSNLQRTLESALFATDTSGSMSQDECNLVLKEMEKVIMEFPSSLLDVVMFDTEIREESKFQMKDCPIKINDWTWKGRGGTKFKPIIDKIRRERPVVSVILTDGGHCDGWQEDPGSPVIWLVTEDVVAPYGRTIRMKV